MYHHRHGHSTLLAATLLAAGPTLAARAGAAAQRVGQGAERSDPGAVGAPAATEDSVPGPVAAAIEAVAGGLLLPVQVLGESPARHRIEARMRHHRVPAVSVAVVEGGRIAWARAWGMADVAEGRPADPTTLFQAASVSKPVAALAALRLADRDRIDLDADVGRYLRRWRPPRAAGAPRAPVTLRELLSHTAGLGVHGFRGYAAGEPVPGTVEVLEGAGPANSPPVLPELPPGSEWRYSGGGYVVAQLLVEEVTGRPFAREMRGILDALGMTGSTFSQPLPDSLRARAAAGYRSDGSPLEGGWHTYPEEAAAGLWATPSDLARYMIEVGRWLGGEEGGVLSPAMTREMLTPGANGWGLGPGTAGSGLDFRFEHGGSNEGYRAHLVYFPRRGIGAVIMTNGDEGTALAREVLLSIADAYRWPDIVPEQVRALPLEARAAIGYAGRYRIPEAPDLPLRIEWRAGRLRLRLGDRPPAELVRVAADRFVIMADGTPLRFERGPGGRVVAAVAYGSRASRIGG